MRVNKTLIIILLSFICINSQDSGPVIHQNDLPSNLYTTANETIRNVFNSLSTLSALANDLVNKFDANFGAEWFCTLGHAGNQPQSLVVKFEAAPKTLLWFTYKNIEVILFKPVQVCYHFA